MAVYPGAKTERNSALVAAIEGGRSAADVGREYGLTRERVRQIWTRHTASRLPRRGVACLICGDQVYGVEGRRFHAHTESHRLARLNLSAARFWAKVDVGSPPLDCWHWTGALYPTGYGHAKQFGEHYAHRLAYKLLVGPIPKGLTIDHLCRVPRCVNPAHLEVVTSRVNTLRSPFTMAAINAAKTHCKWGHSLADAYRGRSGRICRPCSLQRSRARVRRRARRQAIASAA